MGKKEKDKNKRKDKNKGKPKHPAINNPPIVVIPVQIQPEVEKKKGFFKKYWKGVVVVSVIVTIVAGFEPIRSLFLGKHKKYVEENFVEGNLKPKKIEIDPNSNYSISENPPIFTRNLIDSVPEIKGLLLKNFDSRGDIMIMVGGTLYLIPSAYFYNGVELSIPSDDSVCGKSKIAFGVKDERLYVSVEFKDLQKEETIGFIEFNHWKLYKPNLLDFSNDDRRLEVKDRQNNIVFALEYDELGYTVLMSGYFIRPSSILVLNDSPIKTLWNYSCFPKTDSKWKSKALNEIEKIKSIFN